MSLKFFDPCKLHHCGADVLKSLFGQLRTGNVLDIGAEIDS
jgi:hypothetical protein